MLLHLTCNHEFTSWYFTSSPVTAGFHHCSSAYKWEFEFHLSRAASEAPGFHISAAGCSCVATIQQVSSRCVCLCEVLPLTLSLNADRISNVRAEHTVVTASPSHLINSECVGNTNTYTCLDSWMMDLNIWTAMCHIHSCNPSCKCLHQYKDKTFSFEKIMARMRHTMPKDGKVCNLILESVEITCLQRSNKEFPFVCKCSEEN